MCESREREGVVRRAEPVAWRAAEWRRWEARPWNRSRRLHRPERLLSVPVAAPTRPAAGQSAQARQPRAPRVVWPWPAEALAEALAAVQAVGRWPRRALAAPERRLAAASWPQEAPQPTHRRPGAWRLVRRRSVQLPQAQLQPELRALLRPGRLPCARSPVLAPSARADGSARPPATSERPSSSPARDCAAVAWAPLPGRRGRLAAHPPAERTALRSSRRRPFWLCWPAPRASP